MERIGQQLRFNLLGALPNAFRCELMVVKAAKLGRA
jgi:hypothetical protein